MLMVMEQLNPNKRFLYSVLLSAFFFFVTVTVLDDVMGILSWIISYALTLILFIWGVWMAKKVKNRLYLILNSIVVLMLVSYAILAIYVTAAYS